jgi:hypothetical protein
VSRPATRDDRPSSPPVGADDVPKHRGGLGLITSQTTSRIESRGSTFASDRLEAGFPTLDPPPKAL